MPDTAPSSTPATRPVRRIGRSINTILQIIFFLIVIIATNYLSCTRHKRFDLTERHDFTLSGVTQNYLKSDTLQKRTSPVRIIAVLRRSSPHYSRIYNLLDEYKSLAGNALQLEIVDPVRQTDRTLEIENTYHQPYIEDMIIIDGRIASNGSSPSEKTTPATSNSPSTALQKLSSHVRTAFVKDLFIRDDHQNIIAWQDEDVITTTLIGAIEGSPRKFYFAADKTDLEARQGSPAWQNVANMLWQQNIVLTPIRLADTKTIPEDAEGFALIAPQYDLTKQEMNTVANYWKRQKSALFITLDPRVKTPNLRIFLRRYGVTPRHDRIIKTEGKSTLSNVQSIFSRGTEINHDLGGKTTIFDGASCSLEVRETDERLLNNNITPLALIEATPGWWGETRFEKEHPQFNPEEDHAAPLYLAAAVIQGNATSDKTADLISKMVIISNTDFLATKKTRPEQADFVKSSVNWLVGREELIGIGPRKLYRHKLTILDAHSSFISRIVLIFLPAFAILISLIVWNIRRA